MKALVLTDGKPGHEGQSLACCRLLGLEAVLMTVSYASPWRKALSYACDRLGLRLPLATLSGELPDEPVCVIGTGSTTWYAVKILARKVGCPSVAILMPRGYRLDFDLILAPAMDNPPIADNILALPINLCDARPEVIQPQLAEFANRHQQKMPAIGIVIGGDSKACGLPTPAVITAVTAILARYPDHEAWVTTSRRTSVDLETALKALSWDYACWFSTDRFNPIPAFIETCDRLYVTSDSASMLSECVSRGTAAVEVIMAEHRAEQDKFTRQIDLLKNQGALTVFGDATADARAKIDLRACLTDVPKRLGFGDKND